MKKICEYCKVKYDAVDKKGINKRQKFCSWKCRNRSFQKNNKTWIRDYNIEYRLRTPLLCKWCKNPIPNDIRDGGVVFCSKHCSRQKRLNDNHIRREIAQSKFSKYKESVGCLCCKYKKFGGSLDFHHLDPESKDIRITATHWVSNSKKIKTEMKNCILVCKNCHYELHELIRTNKDEYLTRIKVVDIVNNLQYHK